mmetsp:Transcript_9284/g.18079  ORF Transcript_9284/g.18079 Transcript_9284/m.18079 type:complete len:164 (-) Transcript_9284:180-671(-)
MVSAERALSVSRTIAFLNHVVVLVLFLTIWFDENHLFNPDWHPHAKFHLLWNLLFVLTIAGGAGAWVIWQHWHVEQLRILVSLMPITVWVTRLLAHVIMQTVLDDDVFPHFSKLAGGKSGFTAADAVSCFLVVFGFVGLRLSSTASQTAKTTKRSWVKPRKAG